MISAVGLSDAAVDPITLMLVEQIQIRTILRATMTMAAVAVAGVPVVDGGYHCIVVVETLLAQRPRPRMRIP